MPIIVVLAVGFLSTFLGFIWYCEYKQPWGIILGILMGIWFITAQFQPYKVEKELLLSPTPLNTGNKIVQVITYGRFDKINTINLNDRFKAQIQPNAKVKVTLYSQEYSGIDFMGSVHDKIEIVE